MRKRTLKVLLGVLSVAVFVCFVQTQASATLIKLQPGSEGKDTWADYHNPAVNYGDADYLRVINLKGGQGGERANAYIEFGGLPGVPAENILSATLSLYQTTSTTREINAWRVTDSWDEDDVNWTNRPGYYGGVGNNIRIEPGQGWCSWDITEWVKGWVGSSYPNYGISVTRSYTRKSYTLDFHSGDYMGDASLRPKLEIETASVPEPASLLLLGSGLLGLVGFSRRKRKV